MKELTIVVSIPLALPFPLSAEEAVDFPAFTFSSDFTNRMRGAAFLAGLQDTIVRDIGSTSTNIGVIQNGFPGVSSQSKVRKRDAQTKRDGVVMLTVYTRVEFLCGKAHYLQSQVGGVRTNLSMPEILSLQLGGGSTCLWDNASVSSPL